MANPETDHYAVLGVDPHASTAEIRRAFRQLALCYHPDRAGPDATPIFQRIARAYAVLADAPARAAYDRSRGTRVGGGFHGPVGDDGRRAPGGPSSSRPHLFATLRRAGKLLERLSRPLDELVAHGIAFRTAGDDDDSPRFELRLVEAEAHRGGVALIDVRLRVACTTCGGVARPGGFWCRRCESTGRARELVTIYCAIPPRAKDGDAIEISTSAAGGLAPVGVRVRILRAPGAGPSAPTGP
jgi:DnaJ-class molecular chaperone